MSVPAEKSSQPAHFFDRALLTIGLVLASPFIFVIACFVIACAMAVAVMLFGTMHEIAPWTLLTVLAICLVPAIKDRITGKYNNLQLQKRFETLEAELMEAKKQILELEEGVDFHRKLEETNKNLAGSDLPANVTLSVTSTKSEKKV